MVSERTITITDLLALRIVCPFLEDVALAERCVRSQFTVTEVDHKGAEFSVREFGYQSIHCLVAVPDDLIESFHLSPPFEAEVQIRTILQDAWAEVEHELVYKAEFSPFGETVKRKLAALNANLSLSDITFQEIRDYQNSLQRELEKRRGMFWKAATPEDGSEHDHAELTGAESATLGVSPELISQGDYLRRGPQTPAASSGSTLDTLLLEALQAHNAGDFDHAEAVYGQILREEPQPYVRAIVLLHRGIARLAAAKHADALADVNAALELDPSNWRGLFYRGSIHRVMGNNEEAEVDFTRCLDSDPYQVECLLQRARLYLDTGRREEALSDVDRALNVAPSVNALTQLRQNILNSN
jgi:putative GTP pyrophosphokinase